MARRRRLHGLLATCLLASSAACSPGQIAGDADGDRDLGCHEQDDHIACTYKRVDDLALEADVYYGDEAADGGGEDGVGAPAVLWIHGGALIFGHRVELADASEQLASYLDRGYVVVSIDYRLAPATELADIQDDVADAYRWLRDEGPGLGIDPARIGVVGHSAGAYLTLSLGHAVEPRPAALASFYGYGRLGWYDAPAYAEEGEVDERDPAIEAVRGAPPIAHTSLEELDDRLTFYAFLRQQARWPVEVGGHDVGEDAAYFEAFEPLRHVDGAYPPTILLHGDADDDVPFAEATAMQGALDDAGVDVALIHDPRFGHGFDEDMDAPGVRQAFTDMLDFLDEHI